MEEINTGKDFTIQAASHYIPKENPKNPKGEDANFIDLCAQVIGVADGVGSWSQRGVDPGEYARQLMENVADVVYGRLPKANTDLTEILTEAFLKTTAKGSCTACLLTLSGNTLYSANLGDSGFVVIRGGEIVFKSRIMQHSFNCPYQIGSSSGDGPYAAEEEKVRVEGGDIVIVGTDGLFDNVFDEEVEKVVEFCLERGYGVEEMASVLAEVARSNMLEGKTTPFEVAAAREAGLVRPGGKYDDVTVVAALLSE